MLAAQAACARPAQNADWPINGGPGNARYSPLTKITKDNVSQLKVAWTYDSQDAFTASEMQSNIIVADGVAYATTPTMKVVAVNAATGQELWRFDPTNGRRAIGKHRKRGLFDGQQGRIFFSARQYLYAIDTRSGKPVSSFGAGGRVDLREHPVLTATSLPLIWQRTSIRSPPDSRIGKSN